MKVTTGVKLLFGAALFVGLVWLIVKVTSFSTQKNLSDLIDGNPAIIGAFELTDAEADDLLEFIRLETESLIALEETWPVKSSESNIIILLVKNWMNMKYFAQYEGLEQISTMTRDYPNTKSREILVIGGDGTPRKAVVIYMTPILTEIEMECIAKDFAGLFHSIPDNNGEQLRHCYH